MTDGEEVPRPRDPQDSAGFVAQLQALKDWSGLTYRELSVRAEAVGDSLPRSTVANMLARGTLPREELLVAFVRACGAGPEETERWLAARKHLATRRSPHPAPGPCTCAPGSCTCGPPDPEPARTTGTPEPRPGAADASGAEPDAPAGDTGPPGGGAPEPHTGAAARDAAPAGGHPPDGARARAGTGPAAADGRSGAGRTRGLRAWAGRALVPVLGGITLLMALVTVVSHLGGDEKGGPGPAAAAPPAEGRVDIRALHSGLCLNERRGQRSGQVYQVDCAGAVVPRYSLARLDGGLWRIVSDHPDYGPGCSGIPVEAARKDGAPLADQECGKRGPSEAFRIEPLDGDPARGHRLRSAGSGLCVTVPGASREAWTAVVQKPCAPDGAGQLFGFDRPRSGG
ncbi:RICIN domain-containing protein [Streptomyces roseolilacinus]|uniref:RICIN domain-containing protein n=1 Tax=Streptomyces roseolilacinus TaxID=66904 RepID=UPI003822D8A8